MYKTKMRLMTGLTCIAMAAFTDQAMALENDWEVEARQRVTPFARELVSAMEQALKANGAPAAVEACNLLAPRIAAQHSQDGWRLGRTSLKIRNGDNAPDAWEVEVLRQFVTQLESGVPLTELRHEAVVNGEYRYMQAIGVAETCLRCHGSQLEAEVQDKIRRFYPADQATGYGVGDLRGAFTLRKTLERPSAAQ